MHHSEFTYDDYELFLAEALEGQKLQRAEFIMKNLAGKWPKNGLPEYQTLDSFVEKLGEVDPTSNGMYMPWLAKLVITAPHINKPEDLSRTGEDLRDFERLKARIERKDINQYKSFQDLYDAIEPLLSKSKQDDADAAKQKEQLEKVKKDIEVVYNGPEGWIRVPKSEEAAKFLGQNTRWCTAADKNNRYLYYSSKDTLFVIYDKATKHRFQLHVHTGQFAAEDDRDLGLRSAPKWAWSHIISWYESNEMPVAHAVKLSRYTDKNLGAGTQHEALFDLLRKYKV